VSVRCGRWIERSEPEDARVASLRTRRSQDEIVFPARERSAFRSLKTNIEAGS